MNDPSFAPDSMALLVNTDLSGRTFSGGGEIELTKYTPNTIELNITTSEEQFLVLSEVYYPKGWRAYINEGEELDIHKTNHILRGMLVPEGEYTLTLTFEPEIYYTSMSLVWAGNILILLLIAGGIVLSRKKKESVE